MNELYLVTGAAGHLGSAVVMRLLKWGKVFGLLCLKAKKIFLLVILRYVMEMYAIKIVFTVFLITKKTGNYLLFTVLE